MNESVLVLMAKEPAVGQSKTRLCPPLTPVQAAALYEAMLRDTIDLATELPGIDLSLAVTPSKATPFFRKISPANAVLLPIDCVDIGDCLTQVLAALLSRGYTRVCAFNTDGPTLPPAYLQRAFELLELHDLVLGPGEDGGYYLVGLTRPHPGIFTGIAWSTAEVLTQTLSRAKALGLDTVLLPVWYDVDTAADLQRLRSDIRTLPPGRLAHTRRFFDSHNWK